MIRQSLRFRGLGSAYEDGYDFATEELAEQIKDTSKSEQEQKEIAISVAESRCQNIWGNETPNNLLNSNVLSCFKGIRDKMGIPRSDKFTYPSTIYKDMNKKK